MEASSYERQAIVLRFRYQMIPKVSTPLSCIACHTRGGAAGLQMKGFKSIPSIFHIFFSVSFDTEAVIDFSFNTKRTFLFSYDTGSKFTCDSIFFSRVVFLVDSSRSKVIVLYDRQCKIKRCPQNGLTAYTIVIYVWTSERFCGQSVHGNFRGIQCLLPVVFNVIEG